MIKQMFLEKKKVQSLGVVREGDININITSTYLLDKYRFVEKNDLSPVWIECKLGRFI